MPPPNAQQMAQLGAQLGTVAQSLAKVAQGLQGVPPQAQKAAGGFKDWLKTVGTLSGQFDKLRGIITGVMAVARPAAMMQYNMAMKSLYVSIAELLAPAMQVLTGLIRDVAGFINNLDPAVKKLVAGIVAFALGFTAVAKGVTLVQGLVGPLFTFISTAIAAVTAEATAMDVALAGIPIIIGAVVSGLAAMGFAMGSASKESKAFSKLWEEMKNTFAVVLDTFGELMSAVGDIVAAFGPVLTPVLQFVVETTRVWLELLTKAALIVSETVKAIADGDWAGLLEVVERASAKYDELRKKSNKSLNVVANVTYHSNAEELGREIRKRALQAAVGTATTVQAVGNQQAKPMAQAAGRKPKTFEGQIAGKMGEAVGGEFGREIATAVADAIGPLLSPLSSLIGLLRKHVHN